MILLAGIPSEPPTRLVAEALDNLGLPWLMWNQRRVGSYSMDFEIVNGTVEGVLTLDGVQAPLHEITGVYVRVMEDSQLPEVKGLSPQAPERRHARAQHEALMLWLDLTSARVANRPSANASNGSKPWQTRLIESCGLRTPDTLVTNNPDSVREFRSRFPDVIYKSASACRSVVRPLLDEDDARLGSIRWCPVQFQRRVPGQDVRVHLVGQEIFATRIVSSAADYRYATREGLETELEPFDLPASLAEACLRVSHHLELPFAGIDLRIQDDGTAWCFEANPCPGFSYYESHTGQPIAAAVARYLSGA